MPPRSSHGYFGVCFKRPIIDDSGQPPLTLTILAIGNWVKASSEERCIVKGDWELILSTVREPELYHLPTDPDETDNRWADSKDTTTIAELSLALHYWGKRTKDPLMEKLLGEL